MEIEIPSRDQILEDLPLLYELFFEEGSLVLPVLLVRDDGVIYYNDCQFTYFVDEKTAQEYLTGTKEEAMEQFEGHLDSRFLDNLQVI